MKSIIILLVTAIVFCCVGFDKIPDPGVISFSDTVSFKVPVNFPPPVYQFENNKITNAGFILGRALFYEPLLSKDKSISCGNCHQSFAAFANLDHAVSHGVDFCFGIRNAPPIFNLAWQKEFMWDGGVKHIEFSPLNALTSSCEMANSLDTIAERLRNSTLYPQLFKNAFGTAEINSQKMLRALAQFTSILISASSKYDKHVRKEPGGFFTNEEEEGYVLFKKHCSNCHTEPLFSDFSYRNNGLDQFSEDPGRDTITNNEADRGKFRVPSLRNIELTSPYMHDGRIISLEEVLEHYVSGVQKNKSLDSIFIRSDGTTGLRLNATEQSKIIAFLKTLSDTAFVNNTLFKEPK